jgi:glucosyl-3-phosphoglycerate synthase
VSAILAYVRPDVRRWYETRACEAADWPLSRLLAAKGDTTVSVVLPARDEAATIRVIVAMLRHDLAALVDELVVVDSASTDSTAAVAESAGAAVVRLKVSGKGRALAAGLAATEGDLVVFLDADLQRIDAGFVTGLLGPLVSQQGVHFVKGSYGQAAGRVTELVARPLLNLHWPQLAGFSSPLAGEYAARRRLLETCAFEPGYGVDLGLLLDALSAVGLEGMTQVDLGQRVHRHHSDATLGLMAAEVWQAALRRLGLTADGSTLTQFQGARPVSHDVTAHPLPPLGRRGPRAVGRAAS